MDAFVVVNPGAEDTAIREISELTGIETAIKKSGAVTFTTDNLEDFCKLGFRLQSASRLCNLMIKFEVDKSLNTTISSIARHLSKFEFLDWACENDSFVVKCERYGHHDFTSVDFAGAVMEILSKNKNAGRIDYKSAKVPFYAYIRDKAGYLGIDIAGFDLGMREYRIFGHSSDIKAVLAYSMIKISGYNPSKLILDPFSRSGSIAIEAALYGSKFPVNFHRRDNFSFLRFKNFSMIDFEQLFSNIDLETEKAKLRIFNYSASVPYVRCAEKNAKLAGVNKQIKFGRLDLEWLELKFNPKSVDCLVSYPPYPSKYGNLSAIKSLYSELFYQAKIIMAASGNIALIARDDKLLRDAATKHDFKLTSKYEFSAGTELRYVLVFNRK